MYMGVYTYVYYYELTIYKYMRKCIYVFVYINLATYLRMYEECVGGRMHIVREPLIQTYEWR